MKSLYLLLLLTGSVPLVLPAYYKYYLIQQGRNWNDSKAYCQATYTDLAIIKNDDQMVQLQSESQKQQLKSSAWIGLYNDINSWRWSFGNEPLGSMTKWKNGEPNNNAGRQECVAIYQNSWFDKECTNKYSFVCFEVFTDSRTGTERYINISDKMTWLEAQRYCRQYHTDLASIITEAEHSLIMGFFSNETWIGLFRDSWKWIDKTNFSTISWIYSKPNKERQNCGYLYNSQVGDALCTDIMPFFCYSEIARKNQIVRVKIRSNQDMKDSAVQVAIFEQIKQKLKDHGMAENVTVKWREQPDGLVFHKEKRNNSTEKMRPGKCDL